MLCAAGFALLAFFSNRYRRNHNGILDRAIQNRSQLASYAGAEPPRWDPDGDRRSQQSLATFAVLFGGIGSIALVLMVVSRFVG